MSCAAVGRTFSIVALAAMVAHAPPGRASSSHDGADALVVGCSTQVASARPLATPSLRTASVPGLPTAAVETADGHWAFASLTAPTGGALEVLSVTEGRMTPVRTVVLPGLSGAFGMALTHDGRLLVVAGHNETAVVSVAALETGKGAALVGTLVDNARASSRWRCRPTTITSS